MIYDPKYYYYEQAVLILIATRWTSLHIIVTPIFVSDRHHQRMMNIHPMQSAIVIICKSSFFKLSAF